MENRYLTRDEFSSNLNKEMICASQVYKLRKKNGIKDYAIASYDFVFTSNSRNKLDLLRHFLEANYKYKRGEIKLGNRQWELSGDATAFPVDEENLVYWALDLYCKGYEFDCKLEAYGAMADLESPNFPKMDIDLEDYYFELGMEAYNKRNLGMAIIHFSTVIKINPQDPNAWYSRAIFKEELHMSKAARQDYDKAIELAPDFVDAIVNRAANKDEAGEYDEAISDYNRSILLDDTNDMAYFNRGNAKFNKGISKAHVLTGKKPKN